MTAKQLKEWLKQVDDNHEIKIQVKTTFESDDAGMVTQTDLIPLDADGFGWMECVSCGCELGAAIIVQDAIGKSHVWLNTTGDHKA